MEGTASLKGHPLEGRSLHRISASTSISLPIHRSLPSLYLAATFAPLPATSQPDTLITPPWHRPFGHSSGRSSPAIVPTGRATSRRTPRPRASAHSPRRTSRLLCTAHQKTTGKPRGEFHSPSSPLHSFHNPPRLHPDLHLPSHYDLCSESILSQPAASSDEERLGNDAF